MNIRFAPRALKHLQQIHAFIERDKPDAAANTIERVLTAAEKLQEHPNLGRPGRRKGTRELVHPPFLIVYRIKGDAVEIAAVLHGNRKYE
ncbi:MAG: type II toxin-antitoxin system RelE/ParE family toxin [Acidobacteriota bacterium]|nr:type II toxin-antitoxin system RelE/ParE family toxin [Acidobacteriota bacterium]